MIIILIAEIEGGKFLERSSRRWEANIKLHAK